MDREAIIKAIETRGLNTRGKRDYLRHLKGERLTQRQAIAAQCYDCQGFCQDGRPACDIDTCALHPYSPFGGLAKKHR